MTKEDLFLVPCSPVQWLSNLSAVLLVPVLVTRFAAFRRLAPFASAARLIHGRVELFITAPIGFLVRVAALQGRAADGAGVSAGSRATDAWLHSGR